MSQQRLFELVYYLLEHGKTSAPALAQRFEVSLRTIYRDVDALSAAGVPVYAQPGRGGGVALMDRFVLDRALLSPQEQTQLLTALRSLSSAPGLEDGQALRKLAGLFRRREPDWLEVDLSRWGGGKQVGPDFSALRRAILERKAVSFLYASSGGRTAPRQVLPVKLVFKGQAWYLQAWCPERRAFRTFKLTRMRQFSVTRRTLDAAPAPPPIDVSSAPGRPLVRLLLRFSPAVAYRVYDEFAGEAVACLPDGSLQAQALFPEDNWVYGYLLSFGASVDILAPERVRAAVARLAGQVAEKYENPDIGCQGSCGMIDLSHTKEALTMTNPENIPFCQSCGMPLSDPALRGTERDGTASPHYCKYCYQDGAFTGEMTMEQMIDFCAPMMVSSNPGMSAQAAKEQMRQFFPRLLRWKKAES